MIVRHLCMTKIMLALASSLVEHRRLSLRVERGVEHGDLLFVFAYEQNQFNAISWIP